MLGVGLNQQPTYEGLEMSRNKWEKDPTGPGEVKTTVRETPDRKETHYLRTEDNAAKGSKEDHSHSAVFEKPDGRKTGHGFHSYENPEKK